MGELLPRGWEPLRVVLLIAGFILALAVLLRGRASFIVAHRLSTIREADLVLVLDAGRVVERGAHEDLLYQNGEYARLHRRFMRGGGNA